MRLLVPKLETTGILPSRIHLSATELEANYFAGDSTPNRMKLALTQGLDPTTKKSAVGPTARRSSDLPAEPGIPKIMKA